MKTRKVSSRLGIISMGLVLALLPASAWAAQTFCVFDPSGANGDAYAAMKELQTAAAGWGVELELKPYTNEKTAADDFKAKKCDAVFLTGTRARDLVKFTSTLEAMGALSSYDMLEDAIKLLAKEKAAKMVKSGDYETAAIIPMGAVYLFVRDKSIKTIESLAGKSISTLDYDDASKAMVKKAGASATAADVSTFAGMFNNGSVDACYAPATVFKPLELEKGLKKGGGIVRYPLAMLTGQVIIRSASFGEDFGQKAREWSQSNFKTMVKLASKAEKDIPSSYWIDVSDEDKARYDQLFLEVRVSLRDNEKVYDKQMLTLLRRLRCDADKNRAECAEKLE
ncbi:MAG: DUF6091 family protein [Myxococcota bacterium]|nr:DUF6091 family protein [Myxococcota bacterium]